MTLWFVFALMTVAAIFAVLWPLGRNGRAQDQGSEVAVYKDQLAEIERDLAAGLIPAPDAEAARVEISRRLLAAAASEPVVAPKSNLKWRRAAAVLALAGLPLVAIGVYMPLGSPRLQDFPLAQRERGSGSGVAQSLENLVVQVQQHLEKNPTDGRGWNVLAPVLERLGRFDDAVRAYRNSLTYNGESAERRSDLGEAISAAAGGVVTVEAKAEFERAHALNADDPKANYFLGLAAEQDGRKDDAATIWRALLAKAPADAPWRALVQSSLVRVGGGTMPALSDETIAASKDMAEGDRNAMVRGMVDRLATRLKQNGDDVDGWLRLVRAYLVMGERDKAMGASADARQAVASDAERLRQLDEGLRTLGLGG
ncbi:MULTISPECIES: c-type cytochrome biogenesis protein CcmI [Bradyrhizobium]|uniref:C-type cytochrome biogenesis protein CcmI n=1 Tax=Bradyrhizobium ottawaense TaxID=931866 RepID=A0A2U8PLA3_9BRAD|nr:MULTISPECIES: c-type cytochrome biogenesis protein CcmI [Bradyrhizobium]AWL98508.1 c-type cytochrome biogenesis protein CcmI [Bradyrhizobium ottawaense]MBR1289683.1 c-type cytochrome biogenesis protein CcmI [Bradyrhizobium ottawaense]MBR1329968.1 c-type cytochrome biogenesis protein CcmI [Bradyrhizobium ottawaense]MBR1333090.1 c-type cytochrome biogenesis protein CcmI [Bradyrhizobium ottawaense]MBR1364519.1 c-type cytochrome biogenesis protein CcmI [Bradyrhizobium ottawaense]